MSRRHFGTDGVRGVANRSLTPEFALRLGIATGRWIREVGYASLVFLGRDTRRSGSMLGAALAAGLNSAGVEAVSLGVVPTGGVSHAVRTGPASVGAVISASHNPAPDNGIKLLSPDGRKLSDEQEARIEALLDEPFEDRPTGAGVGTTRVDRGPVSSYREWLASLLPERLDGLRMAVDASNGAAHEIAPALFRELGAEVVEIGTAPDGLDINSGCGATRPEALQALCREQGLDFGVAFDGDADRAVFSDRHGRLVNGDRTMAIWCAHEARAGRLAPPIVVGTVMSNRGFELAMHQAGVRLERAPVGDKYVAELMARTGAPLGGEQSGHLIFPRHAPTGDGLVTALELLRVVRESGRTLAELYDVYEPWPQVMLNIRVEDRARLQADPRLAEALAGAERKLGEAGRLSLRPSGTQPVVRLMVEAREVELRDQVARDLSELILAVAGGQIASRVELTHALGD